MSEKRMPPPDSLMQPTSAERDDDSAEPRRRAARKSAGGITLRDVAQLAGVAPITASRALNTPSAVSPKVLQKVREAVEKTGYVPNLLAGGLASNKSRLVAVVVPTVIGPVFQEIVHTLTETLAAAGYLRATRRDMIARSRRAAVARVYFEASHQAHNSGGCLASQRIIDQLVQVSDE